MYRIFNEIKDKQFPASGSQNTFVSLRAFLYVQGNRTITSQFLTQRICTVLFSGEGPRSSGYRRTAALRLLVQPYDEDYIIIIIIIIIIIAIFQIVDHRWNETDRGKPKCSRKKLSQFHFCHHKSHMD
jgi:hypothetical protein